MNLVPNKRTRQLAQIMVRHAHRETGLDAAARWLPEVEPDQVGALIGLLLTNVKVQERQIAPRREDQFTDAERKAGYAAYKKGSRSEWAIECFREYQRLAARRARRRANEREG